MIEDEEKVKRWRRAGWSGWKTIRRYKQHLKGRFRSWYGGDAAVTQDQERVHQLRLGCVDTYRVTELYDLREEKPPAHSGHLGKKCNFCINCLSGMYDMHQTSQHTHNKQTTKYTQCITFSPSLPADWCCNLQADTASCS